MDIQKEIPVLLDAEKIDFAAKVLKLIANPSKLAIIDYLHRRGEATVNELADLLGQSQPLVSHHLISLKNGGIINCRREGKSSFYYLSLTEVISVLECMANCRLPGK